MADIKETTQYNTGSDYLKKLQPIVQGAYKKGREIQKSRGMSTPQSISLPTNSNYNGGVSDLSKYPITVPFQGSTRYEKNGAHTGLDIGTPGGTKIPAVRGGIVSDVRNGVGWTPNNPSYGNYVIIKDKDGNSWRYSHLTESPVRVGDVVEKGSPIGISGATGSTYSGRNPNQPGYHVDIRVLANNIKGAAKRYIDPTPYIYGTQ